MITNFHFETAIKDLDGEEPQRLFVVCDINGNVISEIWNTSKNQWWAEQIGKTRYYRLEKYME